MVTVSVSEIGRSNCVGPFNGAGVNVACTYEGQDGVYCLAMPMSTDTAVIFGRELYAEPKKLADIELDQRPGGHVRGTVTRRGITIIELRGRFEDVFQEVTLRYELATTTSIHAFGRGAGFAHDPESLGDPQGVTHRTSVRWHAHFAVMPLPTHQFVLSITGVTLSEAKRTPPPACNNRRSASFMPYALPQ